MGQLKYSIIKTAREGVNELDRLRREQGISQMAISHIANMPDNGMQYYRMYKSGDIKVSKFLKFLKAVGCEMIIIIPEKNYKNSV